MAPSGLMFYNMSFYLSAYKAVEPVNYGEKVPAPISLKNFGAPQLPAPILPEIFGDPEPIKDDGNFRGRRFPHSTVYGDPDSIKANENRPEASAAHLLEETAYSGAIEFPEDQLQDKEAFIICARPCLDCTDPTGRGWALGREWFHIKDDGVDKTIQGQWISKRYTAGTRYYFLVSRQDYENGLQWCKEMGYPYVQPERKDRMRWHLFAINGSSPGNEQLMPGCSTCYPSDILTCSNEFGF